MPRRTRIRKLLPALASLALPLARAWTEEYKESINNLI
jgi:hypothetical protein